MPKTYLASKVASAWIGGPLPGFSSWQTDQGNMREDEAQPWYEFEYKTTIDKVGFCTTEDGKIGCSPDGLLGDDSGLEIKCPEPTAHVKYLLNGEVPDDYLAQVHGCMFVTGRPMWKFLSYRRGFPALLLTVHRDDKIVSKLADALAEFLENFDVAFQKLVEANGGPPPKRKTAPNPERVKMSWEMTAEDIEAEAARENLDVPH